MPTYEYLCQTCSHRFETWQKMTDEPLTVCPECNGNIRRVLFPAGVVFKGSGFYVTDHSNSNKSAAPATTENKSTESKTSSDSATKSESTSSSSSASESKASTPAAAPSTASK